MAMLRNQVSELLWYGEIETTVDRAKEVRRLAEKIITLAIRTYQDEVAVTKTKTDAKGGKSEVTFTNDGAKKLAARRKMMAELRDLQEVRREKESKTAYNAAQAVRSIGWSYGKDKSVYCDKCRLKRWNDRHIEHNKAYNISDVLK